MDFDQAFDLLLGNEGGYSNNSNDPGGETNWGITARTAYANGFRGSMLMMTRDQAKSIYRPAFWDAAQCDKLPDALRFDFFDTVVNSGPGEATKLLQRALGVTDDGALGPMTLAAAAAANPDVVLRRFNGHRLKYMKDLPTWRYFSGGWAGRIADNLMR